MANGVLWAGAEQGEGHTKVSMQRSTEGNQVALILPIHFSQVAAAESPPNLGDLFLVTLGNLCFPLIDHGFSMLLIPLHQR